MDAKATVNIGACSRGGLPRGDHQARDHEMGGKEQEVPGGIVEEESAELTITLGSSAKPSDCIVDVLAAKGDAWDEAEKAAPRRLQSKSENGPESSGRRTPLRHRMVQLADASNKPMQRLYSPPDHSK